MSADRSDAELYPRTAAVIERAFKSKKLQHRWPSLYEAVVFVTTNLEDAASVGRDLKQQNLITKENDAERWQRYEELARDARNGLANFLKFIGSLNGDRIPRSKNDIISQIRIQIDFNGRLKEQREKAEKVASNLIESFEFAETQLSTIKNLGELAKEAGRRARAVDKQRRRGQHNGYEWTRTFVYLAARAWVRLTGTLPSESKSGNLFAELLQAAVEDGLWDDTDPKRSDFPSSPSIRWNKHIVSARHQLPDDEVARLVNGNWP